MIVLSVRFGIVFLAMDYKVKEKARSYERACGGRNRTRTCDPIDVNDVLYQLSHATKFPGTFLCVLHKSVSKPEEGVSWLIWTVGSTN